MSLYVGHTLRKIRESSGLSQAELASRAGVDRTYISMLERGHRNMTLSTIDRLLTHLNTSQFEFLPKLMLQVREECRARIEGGMCSRTLKGSNEPCLTNGEPEKVYELSQKLIGVQLTN